MSKLNRLWKKFKELEQELESVHDANLYAAKKEELLDIYSEIQELESEMLVWHTSASY